ncbi:2-oxoacid:acceptor oxidoreductase subunit alpha [Engelhardtia mirabilis]|uniref:2-oxoglutarate oxidoreductase subunit KorA n=1 Tax=Engelhardtia mirabilis TaxID=2528011 RepID=A0A518BFW1_9BACT|nr:2-oxoglutarate oxidoreductase subunit KorA [Planctomycetes bacterium Pla133]QDV00172.1 2-oxoglutarate oxidoreductase subunit KorA [Planctomycetes bacterium Pla86]
MTTPTNTGAELPLQQQESVVIRFAGDSGDGMQITGNQFTSTSAAVGNDLATLPDFPAEIRAPVGTRPGVSGFQVRFSSSDIHTPGDAPDVLVAMNPAALVVNLKDLKPGGMVILNTGNWKELDLKKARCATDPRQDGTLDGYRTIEIDINERVKQALTESGLSPKDVQRCKNFYTLGLMYWLYSRPLEPTLNWLAKKFAKKPDLVAANQTALKAGFNAGDIHEHFQTRYDVPPCTTLEPGTYRNIMGNQALSIGLVAGAQLAGLDIFLGSYPITPASDILHELAGFKNFGVRTFQAEDEIAAICSAIGASFAGHLGLTTTSGPGMALKTEAMGLAIATELPLVIVDIQRAGPSTGMPTKTEQSDLYQAVLGRNGDAPMPVVSCSTPSDCFETAIEAVRIAVQYMTPVILLSDGYIANGSEPWRLPEMESLKAFPVTFHTATEGFSPVARDEKLARPWAIPGTPGLEHRIGGLEKDGDTGNISYDAHNHERMSHLRAQKVMNVQETIPDPEVFGAESGDVLVCGWGSTAGSIRSAVEICAGRGLSVGAVHLRHIWPMAKGLDGIFSRFRTVLVPELNMGQMCRLLRSEFPKHDFASYPKVQGLPFATHELVERIEDLLKR